MAKTKFVDGDKMYSAFANSHYAGGAQADWAASTAYAVGALIEPVTGEVWRCVVAGTSDTTEPTWGTPTVRDQVADNTVTWEYYEGHVHDGGDMDGSAPPVLLTSAAEVTGVLPRANVLPARGMIDGWLLTRVTATQLAIGRGECVLYAGGSHGSAGAITTAVSLTKRVLNTGATAYETWAAGENNGAVASGVSGPSADQWLAVFVIRNPTTGAIDYLVDSSATAANAPAGWTEHRRLGWIQIKDLTGTWEIYDFVQVGETFLWAAERLLSGTAAVTTSVTSLVLPAPASSKALLSLMGYHASAAWRIRYWDGPLGATNGPGAALGNNSGEFDTVDAALLVDASSQIHFNEQLAGSGSTYNIRVRGWVDRRGRDMSAPA